MRSGIAIDIDETLSHTTQYWFSEMQKLFGNPEQLTVSEMIKKYRYTDFVPYWQSSEIEDWIKEKMHEDKLQEDLPLIHESDESVRTLEDLVGISAYITARPSAVQSGTRVWLDKHNFPKAELICKPPEANFMSSNEWKAEVLVRLYPDVIGIVDDNPGLIEALPKSYLGKVFLYDYHEDYSSDINVYVCRDWEEVIQNVSTILK